MNKDIHYPERECVEGPDLKPKVHRGPHQSLFVQPVRPRQLLQLHESLRDAFPALRTGLSKAAMAADYETAFKCTTLPEFKLHYLRANVLKRYVGKDLSDPVARLTSAVAKLEDSEIKCSATNAAFEFGDGSTKISHKAQAQLRKARSIIARILGPFDWEAFPTRVEFSPGATTGLKRRQASKPNKWEFSTHVTSAALPYAMAFWMWLYPSGVVDARKFEIVPGNIVFPVNKDFETDRLACKEPDYNVALQRAVGSMISDRLGNEGLLWGTAQEYHAVLAKIGSALGTLATLDKSSASDNVALELIRYLFPADWFQVLMDLRSPQGELPDGRLVHWEKLSSMGNGFTFEVETLVFYALARAVVGSRTPVLSVFGDDVILPTKYADAYVELASECGFEFNRSKSFTTGPFRESCGGHYWRGQDVKPFYLQELPTTIGEIINLHNGLVRWVGGTPSADHWLYSVFKACRNAVPRKLWGPVGIDGCLWAEWDECRPKYSSRHQCFMVSGVSRETLPPEDFRYRKGALWASLWPIQRTKPRSKQQLRIAAALTGYFSDAPAEFSIKSEVGLRERLSPRFVGRTQWKRLTAEPLCT